MYCVLQNVQLLKLQNFSAYFKRKNKIDGLKSIFDCDICEKKDTVNGSRTWKRVRTLHSLLKAKEVQQTFYVSSIHLKVMKENDSIINR